MICKSNQSQWLLNDLNQNQPPNDLNQISKQDNQVNMLANCASATLTAAERHAYKITIYLQ